MQRRMGRGAMGLMTVAMMDLTRLCIGKGTLQSVGRVPVCAGNKTSGKGGQGQDQMNKHHTVFDFVAKGQKNNWLIHI